MQQQEVCFLNASLTGVVVIIGSVAQSGAFEISTEEEAEAFPPAQSFAEFQEENFPATANSSVIAEDADPDGDGIQNLLEFAYGADPNELDTPAVQRLLITGGMLVLQTERSSRAQSVIRRRPSL